MTQPSAALILASQTAARRMADRHTPLIHEEWYVAAFAEEVGRSLLRRTLLGRPIVMYRTSGGQVVALDDRCAHRSFPLSRGRLDGDGIVCGYHGFRYDARGECIEVPSLAVCPKGIGVRSYPILEHGPVIWIWMGRQAASPLPQAARHEWLAQAAWEKSQGYLSLPASYVRLHENLLDLTHLSFLHATTLGSPEYARAPYQVTIEDGYFALLRNVSPTTLPPVWGQSTGLRDSPTAARIALSEFLSPAAHEVNVTFYDCALPEQQRQNFRVRTAHLLTPETRTSTHYFLVHGRDFSQERSDITLLMHEGLFAAFREDVVALSAQDAMLELSGDELYEISVPADAPAVAMRRYLHERAHAEQPAAAP